jgi:hypothetical protein
MQQLDGALGALLPCLAGKLRSIYSIGLLAAVGPMARLATAEMVHMWAQFTVQCPDLDYVICVWFKLLFKS